MHRRAFVLSAAALAVGCSEKPMLGQLDPILDVQAMTSSFQALANKARPGVLGIAINDAQTGQIVAFNGDRRFPLEGVYRAAVGAAVLAQVDEGKLRLDAKTTVRDIDLSPPPSAIADAWPERTDYAVDELLERAVGAGDNTAADVLLKMIGGPGALTAWLILKNIQDFHIDRYERQRQPDIAGLASFRAGWKGERAYRAAMLAVPDARRRIAAAAALEDPRDTATPIAVVAFLDALRAGRLLSKTSTEHLLATMTATPMGPTRLKAGMSASTGLAHMASWTRPDLRPAPATNDIGVCTLKDGSQYSLAVFLSASPASDSDRDAIIAEVGRILLRAAKA